MGEPINEGGTDMTKSELSEEVARRLGITKKLAGQAVDTVFEVILDTLKAGDDDVKVQVIPFGSFTKRKRKAREGRDPRTGQPIQIQARTVPVFNPGKALRDGVS
jgi:DNA-binding protein HU-beta